MGTLIALCKWQACTLWKLPTHTHTHTHMQVELPHTISCETADQPRCVAAMGRFAHRQTDRRPTAATTPLKRKADQAWPDGPYPRPGPAGGACKEKDRNASAAGHGMTLPGLACCAHGLWNLAVLGQSTCPLCEKDWFVCPSRGSLFALVIEARAWHRDRADALPAACDSARVGVKRIESWLRCVPIAGQAAAARAYSCSLDGDVSRDFVALFGDTLMRLLLSADTQTLPTDPNSRGVRLFSPSPFTSFF